MTDRDGYDAVYVMNEDGSGQTPLAGHAPLTTDPYRLSQPVWSPDGSALIVSALVSPNPSGDPRDQFGSLYLVPAARGPARLLGPGAYATFSRDGRYVASRSLATPDALETLGIVRVDGTRPTVSLGFGETPTWSPRADRLAFVQRPRNTLTVVDPDGRHARALPGVRAWSPVWSPDGRRIAFLRNPLAPTVCLVQPGSSLVRSVLLLPRSLDAGAYALSWSADGRWLAATNSALTLLVRPDGTGFQATGGGLATWAPRGARLAFITAAGALSKVVTWPDLLTASSATGEPRTSALPARATASS